MSAHKIFGVFTGSSGDFWGVTAAHAGRGIPCDVQPAINSDVSIFAIVRRHDNKGKKKGFTQIRSVSSACIH
jgi:hypothetical protein